VNGGHYNGCPDGSVIATSDPTFGFNSGGSAGFTALQFTFSGANQRSLIGGQTYWARPYICSFGPYACGGGQALAGGLQTFNGFQADGHLTMFHSFWCGCPPSGQNFSAYGASAQGDVLMPHAETYYLWFDGNMDLSSIGITDLVNDATWIATGATFTYSHPNASTLQLTTASTLTNFGLQLSGTYGGTIFWSTQPPS
jgi:hypothetical protein